jgi:DNA-binding XRE family transcriptional regulator
VDPFTNNFKLDQTAGKIEIPLTIKPLEELTREPVTLGDHLRRRRLVLGLYQKEVAALLGVATSTIWNWEHGWAIGRRFIPRINQFLGHDFSNGETTEQ